MLPAIGQVSAKSGRSFANKAVPMFTPACHRPAACRWPSKRCMATSMLIGGCPIEWALPFEHHDEAPLSRARRGARRSR